MENVLAKIEQEKQEHFDLLHKQELISIARAYSTEEQMDVCKVIGSQILIDELSRREETTKRIIDELADVIADFSQDAGLVDRESLISRIRKIVRVEDE